MHYKRLHPEMMTESPCGYLSVWVSPEKGSLPFQGFFVDHFQDRPHLIQSVLFTALTKPDGAELPEIKNKEI